MMQRPLKIRPPCHILPDYFITRLSFKNLNVVQMSVHFQHLWPLGPKSYVQIKNGLVVKI